MTQLTLVTNEAFNKPFKTNCTVKMDNKVDSFEEFVVIGHRDGQTSILLNADALTLGQAYQMVAKAFNSQLQELSIEDRMAVHEYLMGGDHIG